MRSKSKNKRIRKNNKQDEGWWCWEEMVEREEEMDPPGVYIRGGGQRY
jgi:hypothetical protein